LKDAAVSSLHTDFRILNQKRSEFHNTPFSRDKCSAYSPLSCIATAPPSQADGGACARLFRPRDKSLLSSGKSAQHGNQLMQRMQRIVNFLPGSKHGQAEAERGSKQL